jgi:hypothetical protein
LAAANLNGGWFMELSELKREVAAVEERLTKVSEYL